MSNRSFSSGKLIAVIVFVLIAGGIFLLSQVFELVEKEEDQGPDWQASANPMLAAETWFEQQKKLQVRHLYDQYELDLSQTDLLISQGRFEPDQAEALVEWVADGGYLVMQPAAELELPGSFSLLESVRKKIDLENDDEIDQQLLIDIFDKPVTLELYSPWYLTDPEKKADYTIAAGDGYWLLGYSIGDGWLWLVADLSVFYSSSIDQKDHGLLLWQLVGRPAEGTRVNVLLNPEYPNILQLIWSHWKYPLVALLLILAAFIVGGLQRFGSMLPPTNKARRELSEHLRASGIYLWRHGASDQLLQSVRIRLQRRLSSRWPGWRQWPRKRQIERLCELSDATEQQISLWLYESAPKDATQESQLIEQLQGLWKLGRVIAIQQQSVANQMETGNERK